MSWSIILWARRAAYALVVVTAGCSGKWKVAAGIVLEVSLPVTLYVALLASAPLMGLVQVRETLLAPAEACMEGSVWATGKLEERQPCVQAVV